MVKELILMLHVVFGVLGILAALWVFVETLNASDRNVQRLRVTSVTTAVLMWASYVAGGYWYVAYYSADRTLIREGPWPFAHTFFMEVKEHVFFTLLLLSIFLPISVYNGHMLQNPGVRNLVLWTSGLIVLLGLAMEGSGAVISTGVRVALAAHQQ